jgi:carbon storage regulator
MLVLTRRLGETVVIAGNIQVTVVAVQGNTVRLGITAPPAVAVDRHEVHERRRLEAGRRSRCLAVAARS